MENRVLGRSIAILHRREQKYMIQTMKEYGIGYSSYNFLFYLSANPGCSQKEMCENMAVDEALAVRMMKKLQEQGLIEREKSVENGRSYAIYLTEKGEEIIPRLRNALAGWWTQVLSILSEEEQQRMISGVEKMAQQSREVLQNAKERSEICRRCYWHDADVGNFAVHTCPDISGAYDAGFRSYGPDFGLCADVYGNYLSGISVFDCYDRGQQSYPGRRQS